MKSADTVSNPTTDLAPTERQTTPAGATAKRDTAMTSPSADMTRAVDLTIQRGAGPVRTSHPEWMNLLPPCNNACPVGEDIQAWLALAQVGKYRQAWDVLMRDNPMPAVHGRVCYHPCEGACNRNELSGAVTIHAVERFLGDLAAEQGWAPSFDAAASGKRVLVIGAGPAGLSAAYHLTRLGHSVEIHEAGPAPGGMMRFGIPAYRLPRPSLTKEIERIERMGVHIVLNRRVDDIAAEKQEGGFDAVFVAIGAQSSKHVEIPARDAARVLDAVGYLRGVAAGAPSLLGRRVVIYGGGNTAMDAARTARRLGVDEAMIVYRRDRAHMPAHSFEADEAVEEGVKIKWLTTIKDFAGDTLTVERMNVAPDGRPVPTGEFETLQADAVVLALGQETDSDFIRKLPGVEVKTDGTVIVGPDMMTGASGVFAGGDMVPSERTVTVAVGHGKLAARHIDGWLRRIPYTPPPKPRLVTWPMPNLPVFSDAEPTPQKRLQVTAPEVGFTEIIAGLSESEARREAQRCLSCGRCFECDNCFAACPEDAIMKLGLGRGYRLIADRCTGCATCYEQCPCHAIEMQAEAVR
jgi:NADPH-dependent glutamate synthase beta subunit-like oxidoreductase